MSHSDPNRAAQQQQFLNVISREDATRRFHDALNLSPLEPESVPLQESLNRVLAENVTADVDVTPFDRSNMDGFAVIAADTRGAEEDSPVFLKLLDDVIEPGRAAEVVITSGTAVAIATGAVVPRGATAVVKIEDTHFDSASNQVEIRRAVAAGQSISFAGSDIACGEVVLRAGQVLSSREIGVLAAIGRPTVQVIRRPRVAVISTGNEIIPPGSSLPPGCIYDSNAAILSAAVEELGGEPVSLGCVRDDLDELKSRFDQAADCDLVVMSGGTSKGAGDLSYRIVSELTDPGIVAHGVALKPGKPVCLAASDGRGMVVLPGFPTSAVFTFHEFVAPVIAKLAGRQLAEYPTVQAQLPMKVNSERGRAEFLLVSLIRRTLEEESAASAGTATYSAWPMGKGSGSVTTFSRADGFITIHEQTEILDAGATVSVKLLSSHLEPPDLVIVGSHCIGLDILADELQQRGVSCRLINVGSTGGLNAARRGECDLAGVHLLDAESNAYNDFADERIELVTGYRREQGLVFRADDPRFAAFLSIEKSADSVIHEFLRTCDEHGCRMVNRNAGSGTRVLLDQFLRGEKPDGYFAQPRSHNAVAAAVAQGRADWGMTLSNIAQHYRLGFLPVREEHYDFVVPKSRRDRRAVRIFCDLLTSAATRDRLFAAGFHLPPTSTALRKSS